MKKQLSFKLMKILLTYMWVKENKKLIILSFIFSILSAVFASLSLFAMGRSTDLIMQITYSNIPGAPPVPITEFIINLSLMAFFYLIQVLFLLLQNKMFVYICNNLGYNLRKELFNKIQLLPFSYIDKKSTGNIMSSFTNDVDAVVYTFMENASATINAMFTIVSMLVTMFLLNAILASIAVVLISVLLSFILIFIKKSQPHFKNQQEKLANINGDVVEMVYVHKMTSIFNYEDKRSEVVDLENNSLASSSKKAQFISGIIFPYNNFVNNTIISIISILLIIFKIFTPNIFNSINILAINPVSMIILFILSLRQFTTPISNFFSSINAFQLAFAGINRINDIINEPNESSDANKKVIIVKEPKIEFKNINFKYEENGHDIIKNLSLTLKPNTVNAIAGPTGSGKTTIISLLTRFYDINAGEILIDNQEINNMTRKSIRDNIATVLQDSYLFSTSILDNIRCADLKIKKEEVIKAAKLANAHEFIIRLPDGYETKISNGESTISEGEKQLIAIARAFLSKAKIIIFDEATSYVDTKTEKEIQKAMNRLMKGRTSIIIAHRLSTIKNADLIAIIKDGVLIEKGNHKSLMNNKDFYYKLNTSGNNDLDIN